MPNQLDFNLAKQSGCSAYVAIALAVIFCFFQTSKDSKLICVAGCNVKTSEQEDIMSKFHRINSFVDLNTVSADELSSVPIIGEKLAKQIIEYRNRNGRFQNIEELLEVKGIGPKKLEKIKTYCTVTEESKYQ